MDTAEETENRRLCFTSAAGNKETEAADAEMCTRIRDTEKHCKLDTQGYKQLTCVNAYVTAT